MRRSKMALLSFSMMICLSIIFGAVWPAFAHQPLPNDKTFWFQSDVRQSVFIRSHRVDVEIDNQIARTRIEQVFVNDSSLVAEGTYVFPLPQGVTVSDLVMYIDGVPIQSQILEKDEARRIYDEIVRQLRDPALLEYIGTNAIQASVFPIPAGESRKLEIEFNQLIPVENGLLKYVYPLRTNHLSSLPVEELSIRVHGISNDSISNIYSPTHPISISRTGDNEFVAGFETSNSRENSDFNLYYAVAGDEINLNLLSYRESANEDGFFTLLVSPPVEVDEERVIPKDVIIVLDQSGSMYGDKWDQARLAADYVLDNLNASDRFNVVVFSTGVNVFGSGMQNLGQVDEAKAWIKSLEAIGGTNIDSALKTALEMIDRERQTVVLFMTDGLATEGITGSADILSNVEGYIAPNTRIFTFGVGDDVDTFLLDQISSAYRGTSAYVRPNEAIDEEVGNLYNKISAPVLTDLELTVDGVQLYDVYPALDAIPDLFIGSQLVIVGRYRGDAENASIELSGEVENERHVFTYNSLNFRSNAGGEELIPRLWATRRIGDLLNTIRLNGENPEVVDSIVRLSIRYGIITPYTSFLITEDDIFSQTGRDRAVEEAEAQTSQIGSSASGSAAVNSSESMREMADADTAFAVPAAPTDGGSANSQTPLQIVGDRTFLWRNDTWIDTTFNQDEMTPQEIVFLSDAYFELLEHDARVAQFYALGEHVIFVLDGVAYEVVAE